MDRISNEEFPHAELTGKIIGCCIEVVRELGSGFLESVYKNALFIAMTEKGLNVLTEATFEIDFRGYKIGKYIADLIVEKLVIVELKGLVALIEEEIYHRAHREHRERSDDYSPNPLFQGPYVEVHQQTNLTSQ